MKRIKLNLFSLMIVILVTVAGLGIFSACNNNSSYVEGRYETIDGYRSITSNKLVSHDGYSLRINAFFAWLRRSGYTIEYIAERLATTTDDIVLRLRRREKFNERELRILIYLMGAKDAFFVIYFPSFRFRKYVYRCVFGKKMRCRKRRRWKKN